MGLSPGNQSSVQTPVFFLRAGGIWANPVKALVWILLSVKMMEEAPLTTPERCED